MTDKMPDFILAARDCGWWGHEDFGDDYPVQRGMGTPQKYAKVELLNTLGEERDALKAENERLREHIELMNWVDSIPEAPWYENAPKKTWRKKLKTLEENNKVMNEALLWAKPYVARLRDTAIIDKALQGGE